MNQLSNLRNVPRKRSLPNHSENSYSSGGVFCPIISLQNSSKLISRSVDFVMATETFFSLIHPRIYQSILQDDFPFCFEHQPATFLGDTFKAMITFGEKWAIGKMI